MKMTSGLALKIALLIPFAASASENCDFLAPWLTARQAKPILVKTPRDMPDWKVMLADGIKLSTDRLYDGYHAETITDDTLENCLKSEGLSETQEYTDFKNGVPATFSDRSIQDLRKIRGPRTEIFSSVLLEKSRLGQLILFRLVGHFANTPSPTGVKAGFHRGEHSIFMDFSKIPANDWLLVFAHEYAHSLDSTLSSAVPVFEDPNLRKKITTLAARTDSPALLSAAELRDLDRWLIAGLDRGFLAEVRAWALSYEIYTEGLADGAWKPIAWMEEMLRDRIPGETSIHLAIRYLSPRFTDPEGDSRAGVLFTRPLVATRLKQIRLKIEAGEIAVSPIL